jgi:hypothetical protein
MILFNLKQEKKKQGQNDLAFSCVIFKGNITYFESLNRGGGIFTLGKPFSSFFIVNDKHFRA